MIIVELGNEADLNTPLQQAAYFFLNFERQLYDSGFRSVTQKPLLNYLDVENFNEIGAVHAETFASGFEAYIYEGNSPTNALTRLFRTFGGWLHFVHDSVSAIRNRFTGESPKVDERLHQAILGIFSAQGEVTKDMDLAKVEIQADVQQKLKSVKLLDEHDTEDYSKLIAEYVCAKSLQTGVGMPELYRAIDLQFRRTKNIDSDKTTCEASSQLLTTPGM